MNLSKAMLKLWALKCKYTAVTNAHSCHLVIVQYTLVKMENQIYLFFLQLCVGSKLFMANKDSHVEKGVTIFIFKNT